MSWTAPADPAGAPVTGYKVMWMMSDAADYADADMMMVDADMMSATISDLSPATSYTFKVMAMNAKGYSEASAEVMGMTEATDMSLGAPDVTATVDGNSVTIMWTDGANADRHIAVLFDSNWGYDPDHVGTAQTDGTVTFNNVPAGLYTAVVIAIMDDDMGNAEDIEFDVDAVAVQ